MSISGQLDARASQCPDSGHDDLMGPDPEILDSSNLGSSASWISWILGMGDGSPAKQRARNVCSYARLGYVLHTTV